MADTTLAPGELGATMGGFHWTPVDPETVPTKISPTRARYLASKLGPTYGRQQSVTLARFTDDAYGDIQPDGSVILRWKDRLAWVVVFEPTLVVPIGPPGAPKLPPTKCPFVVPVDADTGYVDFAIQSCPLKLH